MVKKIVFSFSGENLDNLMSIVHAGKFESAEDTLAMALKLLQTMQMFGSMGYTEVHMRNAETKETREIFVPHLKDVDPKKPT